MYWWNVDTDETTWVYPEALVSTKPGGVAMGYIQAAASNNSSSGSFSTGGFTMPVRRASTVATEASTSLEDTGQVASLARRFSHELELDVGDLSPAARAATAHTPPPISTPPADLELQRSSGGSGSAALSVEALRKYREAKEIEASSPTRHDDLRRHSGGSQPTPKVPARRAPHPAHSSPLAHPPAPPSGFYRRTRSGRFSAPH